MAEKHEPIKRKGEEKVSAAGNSPESPDVVAEDESEEMAKSDEKKDEPDKKRFKSLSFSHLVCTNSPAFSKMAEREENVSDAENGRKTPKLEEEYCDAGEMVKKRLRSLSNAGRSNLATPKKQRRQDCLQSSTGSPPPDKFTFSPPIIVVPTQLLQRPNFHATCTLGFCKTANPPPEFTTEHDYKQHVTFCHGGNKLEPEKDPGRYLTCTLGICKRSNPASAFDTEDDFVQHLRVVHGVTESGQEVKKARKAQYQHQTPKKEAANSFQCGKCRQKFKFKENFEEHSTVHSDKHVLKCEVCNIFFESKEVFESHLEENHSERTHKCHICNGEFRAMTFLTEHLKVKHSL